MKIRRIAYDAVLIAMMVALGYASVDLGTMKFTFENLPIIIGAIMFGPVDGMIIGALGEFLAQILKYGIDATTVLWIFPYVLSGLLVGFGAKLLAVRKCYMSGFKAESAKNIWRIIVLLIVNGIVVTLANTLSLYIAYKFVYFMPVEAMLLKLPMRIVTNIIKAVAFAIVVPMILYGLRKIPFGDKK